MLGRPVNCPDCGQRIHISKDQFQSGRILGDFIIARKLGAGSIGTVYFAEQRSLYRNVALKILSEQYSNSVGIEAFLKEARAAAQLSHPNLVQALGVGEEGGICFMAMTYIEGFTVKQKIEREKHIDVDEALHVVQQVAEGLYYAWTEAGLIHRDVKPENIMLTKEGAVKLTDLGLAISEAEYNDDSKEREISGSPSYMSPEQFTGEKLDTRCDIYALGVSLYQMISGVLPFDGATLKTVARQHFYDPPKPLNKINPTVPAKVCALVKKMMEKEPEKRFQNMESLIHAIWKVRQNTAPNRDLIPSVHTISLKHLDYDLQKISKERNKQIITEETREKKHNAAFYNFFYISMPLIVIGIFVYLLLKERPSNIQLANAVKINSFGELISTKNMDISVLEDKLKKLESSIHFSKMDFDRELRSRLAYYKEKLKKLSLEKQLKELKLLHDKNIQESSYKLTKLIQKNKETELQLKRREEALQKKEVAIMKIAKDKQELFKNSKNYDNALKEIKVLKNQYDLLWKNLFRLKVYSLLKKLKFDDAIALVKVEKKKHSDSSFMMEEYLNIIQTMKKFYVSITNSGSRYAGIDAGKGGKVKNIIAGMVHLVDFEGSESQMSLTLLPIQGIVGIARKCLPDVPENKILKLSILFSDNVAMAPELLPKDKEINNIAKAIADYKIEKIKMHVLLDKKRAKDEARAFIKEFAALPEMSTVYKPLLKKIFEK
jgi:serine/threonine protein kinase